VQLSCGFHTGGIFVQRPITPLIVTRRWRSTHLDQWQELQTKARDDRSKTKTKTNGAGLSKSARKAHRAPSNHERAAKADSSRTAMSMIRGLVKVRAKVRKHTRRSHYIHHFNAILLHWVLTARVFLGKQEHTTDSNPEIGRSLAFCLNANWHCHE
jgi:hypothetical protein